MSDSRDDTKVVVVGQGYVGLPVAMRAVEVGYRVVGYDTNACRIKSLEAGESYVEDVRSQVVSAALATGRYHASTNEAACADFNVALVTVPTPLRDGYPDLSFIENAAGTLADHLRSGATVIVESTTYPGTTEELVAPILEADSGLRAGADFHLGYSPERIDSGSREWNLVSTPKLVAGVNPSSLEAIEAFYDTLVEQTVPVKGVKEAELAKLLENTFRHVNIALVNELAMFAHDLGIDIWAAIDAAATKPFGFLRFNPGPGVGGHCLPIDPGYLSWQVKRSLGRAFRFIELADDVNHHMPEYVVSRLICALNARAKPVRGSRILLLGLAYKSNTGDARQSPALAVIDRLLALGAKIRAVDPHVVEDDIDAHVQRVEATPEELSAADAVVLLTDHDDFDYANIVTCARYLLDTRRRCNGNNVEAL